MGNGRTAFSSPRSPRSPQSPSGWSAGSAAGSPNGNSGEKGFVLHSKVYFGWVKMLEGFSLINEY